MLISADLTSSQIQAAAFVQYQLNNEKAIENNNILINKQCNRNLRSQLFMDIQIRF